MTRFITSCPETWQYVSAYSWNLDCLLPIDTCHLFARDSSIVGIIVAKLSETFIRGRVITLNVYVHEWSASSIGIRSWDGIKLTYRTEELRRRYWKAQKRVHSVVRAHCEQSRIPFLPPTTPRLSIWAQVSTDGKIRECRADSSPISACLPIYDSCSSG